MKDKNGVFKFKGEGSCLQVGQNGEQDVFDRYYRKLDIYEGKEYDFTVKSTGKSLEVKTDTYSMDKTSNFFMERYSDVNKKDTKPGGPWRAAADGVDIFLYYFVRDNTWFQFCDLPKLVERLNTLHAGSGLVYIRNRGWTTGGYKCAREDVMDLCTVWQFDPSDNKKAKRILV